METKPWRPQMAQDHYYRLPGQEGKIHVDHPGMTCQDYEAGHYQPPMDKPMLPRDALVEASDHVTDALHLIDEMLFSDELKNAMQHLKEARFWIREYRK